MCLYIYIFQYNTIYKSNTEIVFIFKKNYFIKCYFFIDYKLNIKTQVSEYNKRVQLYIVIIKRDHEKIILVHLRIKNN